MKRFSAVLFSVIISLAVVMPAHAGGYDGVLEYYTLTSPDSREIPVYERMGISSPELFRIPSGTEVKILRGNPEGWMLIEYNDLQGYATDGGLVILCSGITDIQN